VYYPGQDRDQLVAQIALQQEAEMCVEDLCARSVEVEAGRGSSVVVLEEDNSCAEMEEASVGCDSTAWLIGSAIA